MCGVWIAFEDMDMGNGPLVYYPGANQSIDGYMQLYNTELRVSQPLQGHAGCFTLSTRNGYFSLKRFRTRVLKAKRKHPERPPTMAGRSEFR